jgi:transcription antitermination factor NusG
MDHLEGESRLRQRSLHGALFDIDDDVEFLSEELGNTWVKAKIIRAERLDGFPYIDTEEVKVQYYPDGSNDPIHSVVKVEGGESYKLAKMGTHADAVDCLKPVKELYGHPGNFKAGDVVEITSALYKGRQGTVIYWDTFVRPKPKWAVKLTGGAEAGGAGVGDKVVRVSADKMIMVTPLSISSRNVPPQESYHVDQPVEPQPVDQSAGVRGPPPVERDQGQDFQHGDVVQILSGPSEGRQGKIMAQSWLSHTSSDSTLKWAVMLKDPDTALQTTVEVDGEQLRLISRAEKE